MPSFALYLALPAVGEEGKPLAVVLAPSPALPVLDWREASGMDFAMALEWEKRRGLPAGGRFFPGSGSCGDETGAPSPSFPEKVRTSGPVPA